MQHYIGAFQEIPDIATVAEQLKAAQAAERSNAAQAKELAVAITKLTQYPEWKPLAAKIEEMKQMFCQPPEVYYENQGKAGIDYGARAALTWLTTWITQQVDYIEKELYAKEN